jgi:hypothetical protein
MEGKLERLVDEYEPTRRERNPVGCNWFCRIRSNLAFEKAKNKRVA